MLYYTRTTTSVDRQLKHTSIRIERKNTGVPYAYLEPVLPSFFFFPEPDAEASAFFSESLFRLPEPLLDFPDDAFFTPVPPPLESIAAVESTGPVDAVVASAEASPP